MASLICIDDYPDSKTTELVKLLTLVPKDKEAEEKKKWKFAKKQFPTAQKELISMYQYDYTEGKKYLRVPFRFAAAFGGKLPNREKNFPKVEYKFNISLRDYQVSIVQEAYQQLYNYGTTSLNIYTGGGKTIMSAYLSSVIQCITCVYINLSTLVPSWYNTFCLCFPDMKDDIWIVGDTPMPENPKLIICMDQRHDKIPEGIRKQIGCLIIDEAHLFCTISKVPVLLSIEPKYIIICTATLDRNDGMEIMIHSIAGTHCVTRFSEKPFKLFKVNTGIKLPEESGKMGLDYSKFANEQAECQERNLMAINIIHGNPDHKFMVFTKTKKHVENIALLCKHFNIEHDTLYGSKKKFEDKKVLLFSSAKAGTGFDLSAALAEAFSGVNPDVLILMTTIKAIPKLKQVLGRVLRSDKPNFVYLIDKNNVCKSHYNLTKQMFIDSKAEIKEIAYDASIAGGGVII